MRFKTTLLGATALLAVSSGMALAERGSDGHVNIIYWQAPSLLNPYLSGGTKEMDGSALILEPLARYNEVGELVPWLVDEIPTVENGGVSEDLLSITWVLSEGLLWSDGTPVTAEDVVFTAEYCMHPEGGCAYRNRYADIESVEAVDERTVTVTFTVPKPLPYEPFVTGGAPIIQKAQFENCLGPRAPECTEANFAPIGTGPFVVTNFRPNDVIELEANPNYRDPAKPAFATVTFAGGGDAAGAARSVLQTGEMDYAWNLQLAPEVLEDLLAGGQGVLEVGFGTLLERLEYNFTDPNPDLPPDVRATRDAPHPILTDIRVREALTRAIDRELLVEIGYGETGNVTCNFVTNPPAMASPNNEGCEVQDLDRARELLDEAGWEVGADGIRVKDGKRLSLSYMSSTNAVRQDFQALIQQWWREIGVEARLRNIDSSVFFGSDPGSPDTYGKMYADVSMWAGLFEGTDPQTYLGDRRCGTEPRPATQWQGTNMNRYCNEEFDELWSELTQTADPDERAQIAHRLNDMIIQDYAIVPLVARGRVSARANSLGGVVLNTWDTEMWNIADWYRESD
jgi:peptide/nickel transport system substrate-binding protein